VNIDTSLQNYTLLESRNAHRNAFETSEDLPLIAKPEGNTDETGHIETYW
jgi:hypothetical protein